MTTLAPTDPANFRVIVCDDDVDMRAWLRHLLRDVAFSVEEAGTGRDLLDQLGSQVYDVVVTDVRMPAPSGLEVVRQARARGVTTPMLIITSFPDRGVSQTADALRGVAVLAKPFTGDEFMTALRRLLPA